MDLVGTVEDGVTQAAHPRHSAETEDGLALALGVGMQRVGLDRRAILHQAIQDVNGLPYTAGNEAGEQSDVGIGYVVVGDAAIAAVADMARADQIVFAQLDVRAIGNGGAAAACLGSGKWTYWLITSTIAASSLSTLMCWALIRRNAGAVAMLEACRAV
jgi:hypothetical protein